MIRRYPIVLILVMSILMSGCAKAKESKSQAAIKGRFLFISERGRQSDWLCIIKDGKVKTIMDAQKIGICYWSSDGKYIISTIKNGIIFLNEEGKEIRHIETPFEPHKISQSPSGDKIAYTSWEKVWEGERNYIYIYDLVTNIHQKIATFEEDILQIEFSPQGDRLLCDVGSGSKSKDEGIYTMNIDGSDLKLISKEGMYPSWFPDGIHIGLMSNYGENMRELVPQDEFGLGYVKLNLETGERKTLRERYGWIEAAKISRDGEYLYYSTGSQIVVSPIDNLNEEIPITRPAEGQQDKWPDWYQGE